jgi:hypothetical protein
MKENSAAYSMGTAPKTMSYLSPEILKVPGPDKYYKGETADTKIIFPLGNKRKMDRSVI